MKLTLALSAVAATILSHLVQAEECDDRTSTCIKGGKACTGREGECCAGLSCFGYNFYKTCQASPTCLAEWYDCKNGLPCCDGYTCVQTPSGVFVECQTPTIDTRTVDFTTGLLISQPKPPPPPPTRNLKTTTKITGKSLMACLSGDPHITTFDGLKHDCQGHGEFVMLKSLVTQRQVQGRFKQFGTGGRVSIARGFVIQDEGDTPKVQITAPETKTGFSQPFGSSKCELQMFVDGKQEDWRNYESDKVSVKLSSNGSTIIVKYPGSGMQVDLKVGGSTSCMMNICVIMPPTSDDKIVGLLGSPDKQVSNDWMDTTGKSFSPCKVVDNQGKTIKDDCRNGKSYDYCVQNWCIKDEKESLFFYNQLGANFKHFSRCELPSGVRVVEETLAKVSPEIEALCKTDLSCIEDAVFGGIEMARDAMTMRAMLVDSVVGEGGDCSISKCSDGLVCVRNGLASTTCKKTVVTAAIQTEHLGSCSDKCPCAEGMVCTPFKDMSICEKVRTCSEINSKCNADSDCCAGKNLACLGKDGEKECLQVATDAAGTRRMPLGGKCNNGVDCVTGTTCVIEGDGFRCLALPKCWSEPMKNCDQSVGMPPCCDGYLCVEDVTSLTAKSISTLTTVDDNGTGVDNMDLAIPRPVSRVCKPVPKCMAAYGDCTSIDCCTDDSRELVCSKVNGKNLCLPKSEVPKVAEEANPVPPPEAVKTDLVEKPKDITPIVNCPPAQTDVVKGEWKFFADMFNAGDPNKSWSGYKLAAKAHTKVDCQKKIICIKVEAMAGVKIDKNEGWFKDYGVGTSVLKAVVPVTYADDRSGWSGCFDISSSKATGKKIEIHANYGGNTASTGKSNVKGSDRRISIKYC